MKIFSRQLSRNGARHKNTASGAHQHQPSATAIAGATLLPSRCGRRQKASSTNITICASQVAASRNVTPNCAPARPVADDEAGKIDRENPEACTIWRSAEDHQGGV